MARYRNMNGKSFGSMWNIAMSGGKSNAKSRRQRYQEEEYELPF